MSDNRIRIKKWITENYGKETLEQIIAGKKTVLINDLPVDIDEKFSDRRISPSTNIQIIDGEPKGIPLSKPTPDLNGFRSETEFRKAKAAEKAAPGEHIATPEEKTTIKPVPAEDLIKPESTAVIVETEVKISEVPAEVHVETKVPIEEEEINEVVEIEKEHIPLSEKLKEKVTPESKEPKKMKLKDFLTTEQIVAIKSQKANVFINGDPAKDLEIEIIANEQGEPTIDNKISVIKVLPRMHGG